MSDVRRSKDYEVMLRDLCQDSEKAIFRSYKDLLVLAACIGFRDRVREPFERSAEPVGMHIFRGEFDETLFHAMALVETNDPNVMGDNCESQRIALFEEYANAGLTVIRKQIYESPDDWETALANMIGDQFADESSILLDISEMIE